MVSSKIIYMMVNHCNMLSKKATSLFQSFGLPSLKVKPEHVSNIEPQEGPFGVPNPLVAGLTATKSKLGMSHPLEVSERSVSNNVFYIHCDIQNLVLRATHTGTAWQDLNFY